MQWYSKKLLGFITISVSVFLGILIVHGRAFASTITQASADAMDVDRNGIINLADLQALRTNFNQTQFTIRDPQPDGRITIFDYSLVIQALQSQLHLPISPTIGPSPTNVPPGQLKTKKWNPGHYLSIAINNIDDPAQELLKYRQPKFDKIKGIKVKAGWRQLEQSRGVYNYQLIDEMLNALKHPTDPSKDKQLIIQVMDRDFKNPCSSTRIVPPYVRSSGYAETTPGMCYTKIWEPEAMGALITFYKAIGSRFNNHPQFEGIGNQETAGPVFESHQSELLTQLIRFHREIANSFTNTQVFQYTNWLSIGGGACNGLEQLAQALLPLGHGLSNPDSVPWAGLPWNCVPGTYNYPGLQSNDKPKPMYEIYRRFKGRMPIAVGNDVSQLEDPSNSAQARRFNGEIMDYDGLVKYIYQTFVSGYTYMNTHAVTSAGGNYILWNNHFCNSDVECSQEKSANYVNAILELVNNDAKTTIQTCPSNIRCTP